MTDEEILRRLAEIEGISHWPGEAREVYAGGWNPLTNWSDLGALIERILSRDGPGWLEIAVGQQITTEGWKWSAEVDRSVDVPEICRIDDSLKRAICLAIIEAHK